MLLNVDLQYLPRGLCERLGPQWGATERWQSLSRGLVERLQAPGALPTTGLGKGQTAAYSRAGSLTTDLDSDNSCLHLHMSLINCCSWEYVFLYFLSCPS